MPLSCNKFRKQLICRRLHICTLRNYLFAETERIGAFKIKHPDLDDMQWGNIFIDDNLRKEKG